MLRNAIVVLILLLLALGVADARVPQVGDNVHIVEVVFSTLATGGADYGYYTGKIMSIGDGFICLNGSTGSENNAPKDVCIGIGCISELTWV
jgi:hypothetical protein